MHREITGPLLRVCFGVPHKGLRFKTVLTDICEQIAFVQKDLDKAGDVEDACYYMGMIDAYEIVAMMIAPVINETAFNEMLDKTGTRYPAQGESAA